jgi:hypothetical protein
MDQGTGWKNKKKNDIKADISRKSRRHFARVVTVTHAVFHCYEVASFPNIREQQPQKSNRNSTSTASVEAY